MIQLENGLYIDFHKRKEQDESGGYWAITIADTPERDSFVSTYNAEYFTLGRALEDFIDNIHKTGYPEGWTGDKWPKKYPYATLGSI